jgi:hypothetical protein
MYERTEICGAHLQFSLAMLSSAGNLMNGLAVSHLERKKLVESVAAGRESVRLYERAQDEKGLGFALSAVGDALDECGDYAGAMEAYTRSTAISEKFGLWEQAVIRHHKVAVTHMARGQLDAARGAYLQMAKGAKLAGAPDFEIQLMHNLMEQQLATAKADFASGRRKPTPCGQGSNLFNPQEYEKEESRFTELQTFKHYDLSDNK